MLIRAVQERVIMIIYCLQKHSSGWIGKESGENTVTWYPGMNRCGKTTRELQGGDIFS